MAAFSKWWTSLPAITAALALALPTAVAQESGDRPAETEQGGQGWKLVWSDEFDEDGPPSPRNWRFETGFVRNEELQWYQPENAWCEDGCLIIEARRERKANPGYRPESRNWATRREFAEYTSASLHTNGLHSWQYGRFQIRAKIDTRSGLWPALWTLGVEGEWPGCGEIDIMEYYRGTLLANAAWGSGRRWTPRWDDVRIPIEQFNDPQWPEKFHVWRMDWNDEKIALYVDDRLLNEVDLHQTQNGDRQGRNPLRQPHYLLLSLAVGGTNGGDPSRTEFPARLVIDYVRVFQRP